MKPTLIRRHSVINGNKTATELRMNAIIEIFILINISKNKKSEEKKNNFTKSLLQHARSNTLYGKNTQKNG